MLQERPAGVEPPGVPPGYPPDLESLLLEVVKKKAFHKEKKIIRFSDLPDEGPPGETVSMILILLFMSPWKSSGKPALSAILRKKTD